MPLLKRILNQIESESRGRRIELVLPHRLHADRELDNFFRHFDTGLAERIGHDGRELLVGRAAGSPKKFKLELLSSFVADPITVVILPSRFIE